jgi:hypothetical protein
MEHHEHLRDLPEGLCYHVARHSCQWTVRYLILGRPLTQLKPEYTAVMCRGSVELGLHSLGEQINRIRVFKQTTKCICVDTSVTKGEVVKVASEVV